MERPDERTIWLWVLKGADGVAQMIEMLNANSSPPTVHIAQEAEKVKDRLMNALAAIKEGPEE